MSVEQHSSSAASFSCLPYELEGLTIRQAFEDSERTDTQFTPVCPLAYSWYEKVTYIP